MKRLIHLIGLTAIALPGLFPAQAGEFVVLGNGFRLHADRHEMSGDSVRIFANGGVVEMAASAIAGFEQDEAPLRLPRWLPAAGPGAPNPIRFPQHRTTSRCSRQRNSRSRRPLS